MTSFGEASKALARVAIAVVFTGPVAGLEEAAKQAVDLPWKSASPSKAVVDEAVKSVGGGLERLAQSEHLDPDSVARAVGNAELLIARKGLTAAELMSLSLDADRAAAQLISRSSRLTTGFDDADLSLTRRVAKAVYAALARAMPDMPELTAAYHREVLSRLETAVTQSAETQKYARHASASALLVDPTRTWSPNRYPTSALLRAQYGVVPFWGRSELIADLDDWADSPARVAVRLFSAAGGMGKTRLMIESCRRLRRAGWRTGFLHRDAPGVTTDNLAHLGGGFEGVLVVVDYCETRQQTVAQVVDAALDCGAKARIVLLARSVSDWWYQLKQLPDAVGDFLDGPSVEARWMPALAQDPKQRSEVLREAAESFARVLGRATPTMEVDLSAEIYDRVLFLHLRALAGVEDERVDGSAPLLDFALRREQSFWDDGLRAMDLPLLTGHPIRQAAAAATLAGSAEDLSGATRLLSQVPLLEGQTAAAIGRVAELLHRTYPSDTWLAGVQPDLLGERLVEQVLSDDTSLLRALYGT